MKLYSLGYGGKACYFDLSSDGEPRYLASSSTNSNEDEDGSCWLGFGFEKGTDIYVAHEQTKLPGGEITSGLGTVTQMLICPIMNTQYKISPIKDTCHSQSAKVSALPWKQAHQDTCNYTPQPMCECQGLSYSTIKGSWLETHK